MGQESALVTLDSSKGHLTNLPEKDREKLIIEELEALPASLRVRILKRLLLALIEPDFTHQDSATMIELIVRLRQQ